MLVLGLFTLAAMGAVAYFMVREGIMISFCSLINTLLSGVIATHFWPTIARQLEESLADSPVQHFEDAIALVVVFAISYGLLRLIIKQIVTRELQLPHAIAIAGSAGFGIINGYLISGFLITVFQTLPWHDNFLGFEPTDQKDFSVRIFPGDSNWLRLMNKCYRGTFSGIGPDSEEKDLFPEYERNFSRYRRYTDTRDPIAWPEPDVKKDKPKDKDKDPKGKETPKITPKTGGGFEAPGGPKGGGFEAPGGSATPGGTTPTPKAGGAGGFEAPSPAPTNPSKKGT